MANTTNFNWETPDDTDLVKDGAAAIRTLGSAIDTSLVDLKGGTTDQVLAKNSNTDMDFKWVTSDDANAIQNAIVDAKGDIVAASANDTPARLAVGTDNHRLVAASGETTGLKYVADTQNTVIDAAGDLVYGTAADTLGRLAIGTAGQVLKVNSGATAPEWGAAGGGTLPTFSAYGTTTQSLTANTATKITFGSEEWDPDSKYASDRFTPTIAGYYDVIASYLIEPVSSATLEMWIYKNGAEWQYINYKLGITGQHMQQGTSQVYLDSDDYIEVYGKSSQTATIYKNAKYGYFSAIGVRS